MERRRTKTNGIVCASKDKKWRRGQRFNIKGRFPHLLSMCWLSNVGHLNAHCMYNKQTDSHSHELWSFNFSSGGISSAHLLKIHANRNSMWFENEKYQNWKWKRTTYPKLHRWSERSIKKLSSTHFLWGTFAEFLFCLYAYWMTAVVSVFRVLLYFIFLLRCARTVDDPGNVCVRALYVAFSRLFAYILPRLAELCPLRLLCAWYANWSDDRSVSYIYICSFFYTASRLFNSVLAFGRDKYSRSDSVCIYDFHLFKHFFEQLLI